MICDLAETYGIFNYMQFPVELIAKLVSGLKEDARIWRNYGSIPLEKKILVAIYDNLNWLVWSKTEDGANGQNKPESLYNQLFGEKKSASEVATFETGEDFLAEWNRRTGG